MTGSVKNSVFFGGLSLVIFETHPINYQFNVCFGIVNSTTKIFVITTSNNVGSTLTMVVRLAGVQIQKQ